MASILRDARGNVIRDNTFVTNIKAAPSLDKLFARVAAHAILNSGGRADEPRCHPGTRGEVISRIEKWGDGQDGSTAPIFWLSGPAGAGKSAIVQTTAEHCKERGAPHANFFFFRADTTRSQVYPFIATLVSQLIHVYPSLRDLIETLLFYNPPIIDFALKDQLVQLIVAPLRNIQQSTPTYRPVMFLIDGLDECDSETKRGQQQILQAFDAIFTEHPQPFPFRLLVSSRDESQIRTAFNKLSSQCLRLYLDDTYSPAIDIKIFLEAQFQQVRKTHPLRDKLHPTWPPSEDVDYIVEKSSGQFIFAATVARFISESSAAPTISLARIKGAARLATKSPFSHLDAIYTYILLEVDDQEALKDILNAQLLLNRIPSSLTTGKLLEFYNQKYTEDMVVSCLADLTPLAWYADNKLEFYHASFPDYLFDRSRSSGYFVDIAAFTYKVLSVVCKHLGGSFVYWDFVKSAIRQLKGAPPGLLGTLVSSKSFIESINVSDTELFGKFDKLGVSDADIAHSRNLCRQWMRHRIDHFKSRDNREHIKDIPFGDRYFQMAFAEYSMSAPDDDMTAALSPKFDFDRRESALWLKDLLHQIHRQKFDRDAEDYRKLLKAWILWAVQNGIPLDGPGDRSNNKQSVNIPHSGRYFAMARIERNHATLPEGDTATSLGPESDFDRLESASWLKDLLLDIHGKTYSTNPTGYRKLLKVWTLWAVQNHIPLDGPGGGPNNATSHVDIPYSRTYFAMARIEHNHTTSPNSDVATFPSPESDLNRHEAASWLKDSLHDIHGKMYYTDRTRYRELLKAWISWAVQNDIPLYGPGDESNDATSHVDIPNSRRYFAMARVERNRETPPSRDIATSLSPESDVDRQESASWLEDLLRDIHGKMYSTNPRHYRKLLKAWISLAVRNGIPCDGLNGLPGAKWCIWRNTMQKRATDALKIGGSGGRK